MGTIKNIPVSPLQAWQNRPTQFSEAVAFLQQLIAIPSFGGKESGAADLMEGHLRNLHVASNRLGNNVWAFNKYYDSTKPTILLCSRLDTPTPHENYVNDPFCPEIVNGKLYGLGSTDAGGCLVSLLAAFLRFYHQQHLCFNLCFAAVADKGDSEHGGFETIIPQLGQLDFAIVGKPTLLQMALTDKGQMIIDCVNNEPASNATYPRQDTAMYQCLQDIEWFRNYHFPSAIGSSPVEMTVTLINTNNTIAAPCGFTVEIRNDVEISHEEILQTIAQHIHADIFVRPFCSRASAVSIDHPVVRTGIALGCKTYNSALCSDRALLSCPSIKLGPGDEIRSRQPNEFIYLEEIKHGIELYTKILEQLPLELINGVLLPQDRQEIASN